MKNPRSSPWTAGASRTRPSRRVSRRSIEAAQLRCSSARSAAGARRSAAPDAIRPITKATSIGFTAGCRLASTDAALSDHRPLAEEHLEGGLRTRAVESGVAHAKDRDHAPRRPGPPDPLGLHLLPLRRVLAVPEGRRAVRRRPPRRGGLPHRRGARPPREHVLLDRRALLPGARLRGLPRAPGSRARRVPPPPPQGGPGQPHRGRHAALLVGPEPVRVGHRGRPRERRGDRAQGVALAGRGRHRGGRRAREGADRRHGSDGVLRLLPAPPADAARHPRRDRGLAVAGGALATRAHRRRHARHRALGRAPAPARRARDEDRPPPQGGDAGDRRRDALRGLQARRAHALLLVELPGLRSLARGPALDPPGARLRGLRPRRGPVRRPHPGVPPQVSLYTSANRAVAAARLPLADMRDESTFRVKAGLAEMLKGGGIMDVVDAGQAKIAEDAGGAAVMALERVPADIRRDGGVARMSDPILVKGIQEAVTIPVMAKARMGHFVEAQVLEALEIDYVDESEVLTPADEANHIDKWGFKVPFVCGATNLGEALRRIAEGAAMIRSKGEAGTGDIVEAVRHLREIRGAIRWLGTLDDMELATAAKTLQAPLDLVRQVATDGKLPVVLFCAGGIATPADASLVMQLGAEGVFVGSGIFKSDDPAARAAAIVEATTPFRDAARVAQASEGLGTAMQSLEARKLDETQLLASRGW